MSAHEYEFPDDTLVRALFRIFVVLEQIRDSIGPPMPSRYEETVEALLRQLLDQAKITNDRLGRLIGIETGIEKDVDQIEVDVEKIVPEQAATSATLQLIANS
jgi:hypothetical protein